MAWTMLWCSADENTRETWGYTWQWGPHHLTAEQLHGWKYTYDTLADECYSELNRIGSSVNGELPRRNGIKSVGPHSEVAPPKRDLYILLRDNAPKNEKLNQLWQEVNTVPDWVDWDQIARGQEVFYRYGGAALTGLAYQSLLGGMAANRVVETLARTGGFSVKVARHRMFETTQHILQCTRSLESIKPGGDGHASSIRVRLLHAAVRQRILNLAKRRPSYYSVEKFGVPINDLDSLGTIGSFSSSLIWLSFPRQGIWLRDQEIKDYVALWRLIAHYLGAPTEHYDTPERAKAIMESLLLSEVDPNETSKLLANNIIESLQGQPPGYASRDFLNAGVRWLNGNALSDRLGIGRPGLWYRALIGGQCLFFMFFHYFYRSIPALDRRNIANMRRLMYTMIVERDYGLGKESVFDFKYIPDYHFTTESDLSEIAGIKQAGVERRSLKTLAVMGAVIAVIGWYMYKVVPIFVRTVL